MAGNLAEVAGMGDNSTNKTNPDGELEDLDRKICASFAKYDLDNGLVIEILTGKYNFMEIDKKLDEGYRSVSPDEANSLRRELAQPYI